MRAPAPVHPGVIATELARHLVLEDIELLRGGIPSRALHFKSVPAGAATFVYAATTPELEGGGGLHLEDCNVAEADDTENAARGVRSYAIDHGVAQHLWVASEEMVGEGFDLL